MYQPKMCGEKRQFSLTVMKYFGNLAVVISKTYITLSNIEAHLAKERVRKREAGRECRK